MAVTPTISVLTDSGAALAAVAAAGGSMKTEAQTAGRATRQAATHRARQEAAAGVLAGQQEAPETDVVAAPREAIDSLTFALPNGMVVEFGPPVGVSLTARTLAFYGARTFSGAEEGVLWTMFCLRSVDGQAVRITNPIERDKWLNIIGDEGLGFLQRVYNEYWPPLRTFDLKIIEKKMR